MVRFDQEAERGGSPRRSEAAEVGGRMLGGRTRRNQVEPVRPRSSEIDLAESKSSSSESRSRLLG